MVLSLCPSELLGPWTETKVQPKALKFAEPPLAYVCRHPHARCYQIAVQKSQRLQARERRKAVDKQLRLSRVEVFTISPASYFPHMQQSASGDVAPSLHVNVVGGGGDAPGGRVYHVPLTGSASGGPWHNIDLQRTDIFQRLEARLVYTTNTRKISEP